MKSMVRRKPNKHDKLLHAAVRCVRTNGFYLTTLADIAKASGVPLGNVYYYFRTKESIGHAVVEHLLQDLNECLEAWDQLPEPGMRLKSFVQFELDRVHNTIQHGCVWGSLCQELAKQGGSLAQSSARLMRTVLDWLERQFIALQVPNAQAKEQALDFCARLQGMLLLSHVMGGPEPALEVARQLLASVDHTAKLRQATVSS